MCQHGLHEYAPAGKVLPELPAREQRTVVAFLRNTIAALGTAHTAASQSAAAYTAAFVLARVRAE
jgi:hypothetical protein